MKDCSMLNKYMDEVEKTELNLEAFEKQIEDELIEIGDMIDTLQQVAKDYNGYDFTDELNQHIQDKI